MTEKSDHTDEPDNTGEHRADGLDTPEGVLSPSDLDIDDSLEELEPGRYVVSTDADGSASRHRLGDDGRTSPEGADDVSAPAAYVATVAIRTPDGTDTTQITTNDVSELFDELLVWQVKQLAPGVDPEKALSVLLRSSSLALE